jgi:hypothetical protein
MKPVLGLLDKKSRQKMPSKFHHLPLKNIPSNSTKLSNEPRTAFKKFLVRLGEEPSIIEQYILQYSKSNIAMIGIGFHNQTKFTEFTVF